jgi:peptidoglycan/xylan/chitin deacetylase (PgdA/CDA1 family)
VFRRSGALLALALVASGCGVHLRAAEAPMTTTVTVAAQPAARPNPVLPPPPFDPLTLDPGQTVVTLTFDDGQSSNGRAAQIMNAYGLRGTFFINPGDIGKPGYLTLADLDWIATNSGNEIAGYSTDHSKDNTPAIEEIRHEVCADRALLMSWGFPVRNFAYPFTATPEIRQIVGDCGYNSARSAGDSRTVHLPENTIPGQDCSQCVWAETVPPRDPFYTRAPAEVRSNWTAPEFQQQITNAQDSGGGWVQLTFRDVCPIDCSTTETTFTDFVLWLADQQAQGRLIVRTVGEVIGGPVQPVPAVGP